MKQHNKLISIILMLCVGLLLLLGCGKTQDPARVTLSMLVISAENFNNRDVQIQGTVRHFDTPLHYWLEDENLNRIAIAPNALASQYLGKEVVVNGNFRFLTSSGRSISFSQIKEL